MASLTISWTAPNPVPPFGYRIKYWPTSNPTSITVVTPNVTGTSHTINNLPADTSYAGSIEASCANGTYTTAVFFSATASSGGGGGTPEYSYWTMKSINCTNGQIVDPEVRVALPVGVTPLSHRYYTSIDGSTVLYNQLSATSSSTDPALIIVNYPYTTYTAACAYGQTAPQEV